MSVKDSPGPPTILLVGGPFNGDQHELHAACPDKIGLPDGGKTHWYEVNKKLSIATFTHTETGRKS